MAYGILKKDTFLYVAQNVSIKFRRGTKVAFARNPHPTIYFISEFNKPIRAVKMGEVWSLEIFGERHPLIFDYKNPPYPFSYFSNLREMKVLLEVAKWFRY